MEETEEMGQRDNHGGRDRGKKGEGGFFPILITYVINPTTLSTLETNPTKE